MELTKSDCEDIEMLVNISFSLLSSINKLCKLEIDGNKDNKEFKNILESAKRELALEESIFERLVSNPNKCVDAINYLSDREQHILNERYIIGKTQMEIAKDMDISQAQVSMLEKNAIKQLKKTLR